MPFHLRLEAACAELSLARPLSSELLRFDTLDLELPDVLIRQRLEGGAAQFRHRRAHVRRARATSSFVALSRAARLRGIALSLSTAEAPDTLSACIEDAFGIVGFDVTLACDGADLIMRVTRVRTVVDAALTAFERISSAARQLGMQGDEGAGVFRMTAPLRSALVDLLVMRGWRLPDTSAVMLARVAVEREAILVEAKTTTSADVAIADASTRADVPGRSAHAPSEQEVLADAFRAALSRDDAGRALDALERMLRVEPSRELVRSALLAMCERPGARASERTLALAVAAAGRWRNDDGLLDAVIRLAEQARGADALRAIRNDIASRSIPLAARRRLAMRAGAAFRAVDALADARECFVMALTLRSEDADALEAIADVDVRLGSASSAAVKLERAARAYERAGDSVGAGRCSARSTALLREVSRSDAREADSDSPQEREPGHRAHS